MAAETFEQWRDKQGFPVTSTQEPLWRECWDAATAARTVEVDAAYTQGFKDGEAEGRDEGYSDGYDDGYDEGFNAVDTSTL